MQFQKINLDQLIYANYNPRKSLQPGDSEFEKISRSIREFGYVDPIIVNKDYTIIGGHQRATVLKALGYTEVDVVIVEVDKVKEKALNIALNKISGEWQMDKLKELLLELEQQIDLGMTGFDDEEFKELLASMDVLQAVDDDFDVEAALEEIIEPVSKRGDVYILGPHRLMCGDSTEWDDVEKLMNGKIADLIVTDPPYNVNYENKIDYHKMFKNDTRKNNAIMNDHMDSDKFFDFLLAMYILANKVIKPGGVMYVFHSDVERVSFQLAMAAAGFKFSENLIWVKNSFNLSRNDYHWKHEPILYGWKEGAGHYFVDDRTQSTIFDESVNIEKLKKEELITMLQDIISQIKTTIIYDNKPLRSDIHPTMKPIPLVGKLIKNSSKARELLYEPFGGSGSTLIAADQLDRVCYCMELDPKYVDVIVKRWEEHSGLIAQTIK
ncbi:MAG: site-specific DNA-methyltransferase [Erysipelotrichaceae bacterium]|nr:site-specific DNA-methyltransferase [Erysipelotrichaceae bacterium]